MRLTVLAGILALSAGLLAGCQGGGNDTVLPPPDANGNPAAPMGGPTVGGPTVGQGIPAPGQQAPQMPVQPTGNGTKVAQAPKTSFDAAPPGMPGVVAGAGQGAADPMNMGAGAGATGAAVAKPKPIVPGKMTKFRSDPFVSFVRFVIEKPPAYTLAVPERLAALPKPPPPPPGVPVEDMLPLPQVPRRVAGVLYNGAITAILETGNPPASETRIIAPGAKVPSGVPGIPDLTVDSIAMDRLVLRAEDGRTVEVKLSGLAPAVLQSMQGQFGGGGGGMMGGGAMGGGPMGGGAMGGAAAGGGGADLK